MYTVDKRQNKYKLILKFLLVLIPVIVITVIVIWLLFFRESVNSSASFTKDGAEIAVVKPATKDLTNEMFKISLPTTWEPNGKKNPYSNQVYYEFQNKLKDYDNRWLRVYVDIFPADFAINKLLPISVNENRITPGVLSDDCSTFTGAPLPGSGKPAASTWSAKWQGVAFTCDMAVNQNYSGTASAEEGYGVTISGAKSGKHKYFFVYIDHNVRPDYNIFSDAVKSFQAI